MKRLFRRRNNRISLRLERRRLQLRALRRSFGLKRVVNRTGEMPDGPVLISTLRNELPRLPFFLDYYRRMGIVHFLMIDNQSTDGSRDYLAEQPDISVWAANGSYRAANFGVDWMNWILARHARGRWILCVDPDEFFVYPHCDTRRLPALIRWLEQSGRESFGTLLLDMYSDREIGKSRYRSGRDPLEVAPFFDAHNYVIERHNRYHNLWIQGGPRMRVFSREAPWDAPALNKTPLVKWQRGFVFVTSTHNLLPRRLNHTYGRGAETLTSGALLHMKFLDILTEKVREELERREHYLRGAEYQSYADKGDDTILWTPQSETYRGWQSLVRHGLMAEGGWL